MAISAVMLFESDGDVCAIYDAIVDEMGIRDNAPRGLVYHWCAPAGGGLRVCDVWETREDFERFAQEKIGPIGSKHGFAAPALEITLVHEMIVGRDTRHTGCGIFADFDGDTQWLLRKIDEVSARMNVTADPPEGLVFHWAVDAARGVRVIDHWRSREDFERFVQTRLGAAMQSVNVPQPRTTFFNVYNTIDRRIAARV